MTRPNRSIARFAALGALALCLVHNFAGAEVARESSPVLPEAAQLAGAWRLSADDRVIELQLRAEPAAVGGAPAWVVEADAAALATLGLEGVAAWRPATDGISLAGLDGGNIAFFSTEAGGRYVHRRAGRTLVLDQP